MYTLRKGKRNIRRGRKLSDMQKQLRNLHSPSASIQYGPADMKRYAEQHDAPQAPQEYQDERTWRNGHII